jgi:hypothetical protein
MSHKLPLPVIAILAAIVVPLGVPLRASEIDELKAQMLEMQKTMSQMQKKIDRLESEAPRKKTAATTEGESKPKATASVAESVSTEPGGTETITIAPSTVTLTPRVSQVKQRPAVNDQQEPAPRPNDLTLDPKYRGFVPIPNTPVLIKFNAKPRVDMTDDPQNAGNEDRFVTATIPVEGDPFKGGGNQFNINAKGSQLSLDVRAPEVAGNPRFYFQNDFFGGSGGEFPFRVRHLYGEIYNFVIGQSFSVFEDPDAWPDTVDYEGPNAQVFARRPLVRYQIPFNDHWQLNLGVEKPGSEVDTSIDPDARSVDHAPDGGFNIRWEDSKIGHVQFATILRDIGVKGPITGDQSTFGWGLSLSGAFNFCETESLQAQVTYGEGIFRYINDDFFNNDAAFDQNGDLTPIPFFGAVVGYTHKWSDDFRTTVSYGYAHLDNQFSQAPSAYHMTHYGSLNLVWQMRKRLSLGLEGLYGYKEERSGAKGDAFRLQLGLVYSLFD